MLTDDDLRYWEADRGYGPMGETMRLMARELLAARKVVSATRSAFEDGEPLGLSAAYDAVMEYDEAAK